MRNLNLSEFLQRILVCPSCKSIDLTTLEFKQNSVRCRRCHRSFPIRQIDGVKVPDFYVEFQVKNETFFWDAASEHYDDFVIKRPPPIMGKYEKWEDKILDTIIVDVLKKEEVIFLEIGSGTGRYLTRYGERFKRGIYPFTNLLAIVGIDFSEKMLEKSIKNLENNKLKELIGTKIFLIRADARNLPISFKKDPSLRHVKKVVAIMFGTIGNIPTGREKVLEHLSSDLLKHNAIGVISFFNKDALLKTGIEEYNKITEVVGRPLTYFNEGIVVTQRDGRPFFYTKWFDYNEFTAQIENLNLKILKTYKGPGTKVPVWIFWKEIPRGYIIKITGKNLERK